MNDTITSREDLLLAKVAGKDVDINTMTPPVAMNKKEKLLLDIADRLSNIATEGGGNSGGGCGTLFVTLTEDDGEWTADKTAEEIATAAQTKEVAAVMVDGDYASVLQLNKAGESKDGFYANFYAVTQSKDGTAVVFAFIDDQKIDVDTIPLAQGPLPLTATLGEDANQKQTITLDVTAEELFACAEKGRMGKATLMYHDGNETITIEVVIPVEAFKLEAVGNTKYVFKCRLDSTIADNLYVAQALDASDLVVLTEV